ncbi:MAG: ACP S-malonyltransferase [Planctomycetota bacterium]
MTAKPTAVLFCPGRGSYGRGELGAITRHGLDEAITTALDEADAVRAREGRPTIRELDGAGAFRPGLHLEGRNAAELIYFATMAELPLLLERYRIVAVAGNSLGWYTALAAAGALNVRAGARLIRTMAALQELAVGGQILTTTVDEEWRTDRALAAAVDDRLAAVNALGSDHFVARSIRLGGHEVLAGTERGVSELLARLPVQKSKEREFPFRLAGHGPFHTALCGEVAAAAEEALADLPIRMPNIALIDGRGDSHSPWSADPLDLLEYTTTEQVTTTFDFSAAVRTAMREFVPDVLLCAGPGSSLRAPVGHMVLREGYRGVHSKAELFGAGLVRTLADG